MPIYRKVNKNFFKKWSDEMAYVLGFFAADGSLTKGTRGGYYFSLQSKDKQIILDIKKVMESTHKVSKRIIKDKGFYYRIQVGSVDLAKDLHKLGFLSNKAHNLPHFKIKKDLFRHFLRGYFDGDGNIWIGTIHKHRKTNHLNVLVAFTSASYHFLDFIKNSLNKYLKTHGSLFKGKKNYYRVQYSKNDALKIYNFMYNVRKPYLALKRKKNTFDKAVLRL